jgi:hypothetical protein
LQIIHQESSQPPKEDIGDKKDNEKVQEMFVEFIKDS